MTKRFKTIVAGTLSIIILSGCTSKYPIRFDSTPQGALLICGGKNMGYTPITIYIDREKLKDLSSIPVNCSVKWISRATKRYPTSIPLNKFPNGINLTAQRPNTKGYEKDVRFALELEKMKYQKIQAEAAEEANKQKRWDSINRSIQNMNTNMNWSNTNFQLQQMNSYLRYGY